MQAVAIATSKEPGAIEALGAHWPEYLMEGAALGIFMISACAFGVLLEHSGSPLRQTLSNDVARRVLGGIAMGATAVSIISSPWGQRSGAHMNPALTLTFLTLGKIATWDAAFYMCAQLVGGLAGVLTARAVLGSALAIPPVSYTATVPGTAGPWVAFGAELAISFLLVTIVLNVSNSRRTARFTPWVAGALVALFISIESPFSGMSMNPARTIASALPSGIWNAFWIYLVAPPLGMLAAAQIYRRSRGVHRVFCAKYHHNNDKRCIFRCNYGALEQ